MTSNPWKQYFHADNHSTIQVAIDAAVDSDIVTVRDGVYKGAGNDKSWLLAFLRVIGKFTFVVLAELMLFQP